MPIWQLCANLLIPNCLRPNLSYSPLAALELYVKSEQPVDFTSDFDVVYQKVKVSLFSSDVTERNEKELINALAKVKVLMKNQLLPKDYLSDLAQVIKADALSGYEIRYINQLAPKDAGKLPLRISAEYLARMINSQNKVDEGEETLILSEELQ